MGLHLENEVIAVKTPTIISNNLVFFFLSKLSYKRIIGQVRRHLREEGVDEVLKLNGS